MKSIILVFILLNSALALEPTYYKIGRMLTLFEESQNLTVSSWCKEKSCMAIEAGLKFDKSRPDASLLFGGKNPKSVVCKDIMSGTPIIGFDASGHDVLFCSFKDDSYLKMSGSP